MSNSNYYPRLVPKTETVQSLNNTLIDYITAGRANDPIYCEEERGQPDGPRRFRITYLSITPQGPILHLEVMNES
jgi:hypothetical protein